MKGIFKIWIKWTEKDKMDQKMERLYADTFRMSWVNEKWKLGKIFGLR